MNKFIKRLVIFLLVAIVPAIVIAIWPKLSLDRNTTYFWGDSQTVQGIDLNVFSINRNVVVKTTAAHGAGVYDFLVFANNVPNNTNCVVGFSQCCLLRSKAHDNNRSGIDVKMLKELRKHGLMDKN